MSKRDELLALERQKLEWLRTKVAAQERRVQALEQIGDDPLDEMFEREVAPKADVQTPAQHRGDATGVEFAPWRPGRGSLTFLRTPRRIPPTWVQLLRFIGKEGKSLKEVEDYIKSQNLPITTGAARTALMNYRREFGFIESPRKGFYKATDRATEALTAQEGESPAEDDGASGTQPHPLERAAA